MVPLTSSFGITAPDLYSVGTRFVNRLYSLGYLLIDFLPRGILSLLFTLVSCLAYSSSLKM
jgi:hypothetical protein